MKSNLFFLLAFMLLSNTFTSCSTCYRTDDRTYYLSQQDKSIHHIKSEELKTFLKNNEEKTVFLFEPTKLTLDNIRISDDEGCYADYCEQAVTNIKIDDLGIVLQLKIRNCMNEGTYEVYIFYENSDGLQAYTLIDKEQNIVPTISNYQTNSSTFLNYLQTFEHKGVQYSDVLVFKSWKTKTDEYLIIKPGFDLLYLEYKGDNYKKENE